MPAMRPSIFAKTEKKSWISFLSGAAASQPTWGVMMTKPSPARSRMAVMMGWRLTPNSWARSTTDSFSPKR